MKMRNLSKLLDGEGGEGVLWCIFSVFEVRCPLGVHRILGDIFF